MNMEMYVTPEFAPLNGTAELCTSSDHLGCGYGMRGLSGDSAQTQLARVGTFTKLWKQFMVDLFQLGLMPKTNAAAISGAVTSEGSAQEQNIKAGKGILAQPDSFSFAALVPGKINESALISISGPSQQTGVEAALKMSLNAGPLIAWVTLYCSLPPSVIAFGKSGGLAKGDSALLSTVVGYMSTVKNKKLCAVPAPGVFAPAAAPQTIITFNPNPVPAPAPGPAAGSRARRMHGLSGLSKSDIIKYMTQVKSVLTILLKFYQTMAVDNLETAAEYRQGIAQTKSEYGILLKNIGNGVIPNYWIPGSLQISDLYLSYKNPNMILDEENVIKWAVWYCSIPPEIVQTANNTGTRRDKILIQVVNQNIKTATKYCSPVPNPSDDGAGMTTAAPQPAPPTPPPSTGQPAAGNRMMGLGFLGDNPLNPFSPITDIASAVTGFFAQKNANDLQKAQLKAQIQAQKAAQIEAARTEATDKAQSAVDVAQGARNTTIYALAAVGGIGALIGTAFLLSALKSRKGGKK